MKFLELHLEIDLRILKLLYVDVDTTHPNMPASFATHSISDRHATRVMSSSGRHCKIKPGHPWRAQAVQVRSRVHDACAVSWGADESLLGRDLVMQMEEIASDSTMSVGKVIFAASGDNDSSDGGPTPTNVDAPASCPHVIGCGGTNKTATGETVWE
jgi:hypothetical protein